MWALCTLEKMGIINFSPQVEILSDSCRNHIKAFEPDWHNLCQNLHPRIIDQTSYTWCCSCMTFCGADSPKCKEKYLSKLHFDWGKEGQFDQIKVYVLAFYGAVTAFYIFMRWGVGVTQSEQVPQSKQPYRSLFPTLIYDWYQHTSGGL